MNADGTDQHQVADGNVFDLCWSPDGSRIVYSASGSDGRMHLDIVDLTKGGVNAVLPVLPAEQQEPAWSPDGQTIAFVWQTPAGEGIFSMRLDGSRLHKVADGSDPTWSPDGSWLAYTHTDGQTGPQIWVVAADGSGAHAVSDMAGFISGSEISAITGHPSWGSPAG